MKLVGSPAVPRMEAGNMKATRWIILVAAVALMVAACGDDGDRGDRSEPHHRSRI